MLKTNPNNIKNIHSIKSNVKPILISPKNYKHNVSFSKPIKLIPAGKRVIIHNYNDMSAGYLSPINNPQLKLCFKDTEEIFINGCDKNFFYYNFFSDFHNIKSIYLNSHPCEPSVLQNVNHTLYLSNNFQNYKYRWADNLNNIKIMDSKLMYQCFDYDNIIKENGEDDWI